MISPIRVQDTVNATNLDRMIINYNNTHPNTEYYPSYKTRSQLQAELRRSRGLKKIEVTEDEWHRYMKVRGQIALKIAQNRIRWNFNKPTDAEIEKLRRVFTMATRRAKQDLIQQKRGR